MCDTCRCSGEILLFIRVEYGGLEVWVAPAHTPWPHPGALEGTAMACHSLCPPIPPIMEGSAKWAANKIGCKKCQLFLPMLPN